MDAGGEERSDKYSEVSTLIFYFRHFYLDVTLRLSLAVRFGGGRERSRGIRTCVVWRWVFGSSVTAFPSAVLFDDGVRYMRVVPVPCASTRCDPVDVFIGLTCHPVQIRITRVFAIFVFDGDGRLRRWSWIFKQVRMNIFIFRLEVVVRRM